MLFFAASNPSGNNTCKIFTLFIFTDLLYETFLNNTLKQNLFAKMQTRARQEGLRVKEGQKMNQRMINAKITMTLSS